MTKPEVLNDVTKEEVAVGLGFVAIIALAVDGARHGVKKIYKTIKKHSKKKHPAIDQIKEAAAEAVETAEELTENAAEKVQGEVVQDQAKTA